MYKLPSFKLTRLGTIIVTLVLIKFIVIYWNIDSTSCTKSAFFLLDTATPWPLSQFFSTSTVSFLTVPAATIAAMSRSSLMAALDAAEAAGFGLAADGLDFFVGLNFAGS